MGITIKTPIRTGAKTATITCHIDFDSWDNYFHIYALSSTGEWFHKGVERAFGSGTYNNIPVSDLADTREYDCKVQVTNSSQEVLNSGKVFAENTCVIPAWGDTPVDPDNPGGGGGDSPDPFEWSSIIEFGKEIKISANEWNRLIDKVEEWEMYKYGDKVNTFFKVKVGDIISAFLYVDGANRKISGFNDIAKAINDMGNSNVSVKKNANITADAFNNLRDALEGLR